MQFLHETKCKNTNFFSNNKNKKTTDINTFVIVLIYNETGFAFLCCEPRLIT